MKGKFFTDKQGRVRYIGGKTNHDSQKDVPPQHAPQCDKKAGSFITTEGRVVFVGGPGSGGGGASGSGGNSALSLSVFSSDLNELGKASIDKGLSQEQALENVMQKVGLEMVKSGRDVSILRTVRPHKSIGESIPVGTLIGVQHLQSGPLFYYGVSAGDAIGTD